MRSLTGEWLVLLSVSFSLFMKARHTISRTEYDITVHPKLGQEWRCKGGAMKMRGLQQQVHTVYTLWLTQFSQRSTDHHHHKLICGDEARAEPEPEAARSYFYQCSHCLSCLLNSSAVLPISSPNLLLLSSSFHSVKCDLVGNSSLNK